jgi:autophagy-related protein 11
MTPMMQKEIYVYDNRLTQASMSATSPLPKSEIPLAKPPTIPDPPNAIDDTRSVQSWQELFESRRAWAAQVVDDCRQMTETTQDRYGEIDVMMRCLYAAVANLESVVKGLENKYSELQKWVPAAQADYSDLTTRWEQYLSLARSIPVSPSMVRFMTGRDTKGRPLQRQATLEDLVDLETARRAGRLAPAALRKFSARIADLDKVASGLFQDAEGLFRDFDQTVDRSYLNHTHDSLQLLDDIEAVAKKVDTDYQTVMEYSARDVHLASKIASNHTKILLPSLVTRASEMYDMLRYATQSRNSLAAESVEFMRTITDITSLSHSVKSQVNSVNQEDELATFDYLRLIQQVPFMYASFVAEAVRRREWFDKVKQDSSTLANEMALFQDEEAKRRRRWNKSIGDAYGPESPTSDNNVPGLEINLLGEDDQWPVMSKKELDDFFDLLQRQKADADLVSDIGKLIAEASNPTKQQSKRLKAFKNGSIHEAALGRSGLLVRGDDDLMRSLQDDKAKLENKLKTAESRVRRLEDLLHRQSQASRPSLGPLFQMPSQQFSDRNDSTLSVRSPRMSEHHRRSSETPDTLVQRIQQLEGELNSEKERSAMFEKDLNTRTTQNNDIKGQIEEVNSTKKDLLENMEALKREFIDERKALEDEVKRLQARLEETEDEIEHFGESRENEKVSYDEKVRSLEIEVERLSKERKDDGLKAEGQVEFLRKESRLQRERVETLEKQLYTAQEDAKKTTKKLEASDDTRETLTRALRDLHEQFSPTALIPTDPNDLVEGVSGRSADLVARLQSAEGDMTLLKSDLDLAQNTAKDLRSNLAKAEAELSEGEIKALHVRENLAEERARVSALERELAEGRDQLNQLHIRLADGETGSESLRKRLVEQEEKISSVAEELASRQSQVGSLEEELRLYKEKLHDSQSKLTDVTSRLESRTERTKDLTQRLYSQNDRLLRLLDRLGFSVSRQGDSMVITKVPRAERSTQNLNETSDPGSNTLRKSATISSRHLADSADLELLYWMNAADPESESEKFAAFLTALGNFDTDAFSDAVYRRMKDVEHAARKLQRDARAYREKAHGLQKEAHDKIAFKHFKEGDLALFLPTRNQTTGAWAAFNVGFPHYFLREQEGHRLRSREWLVARISKIQERVVDLSKSLQHGASGTNGTGAANETDSLNDDENDNPFDLSDGLRWYLIDALEDKPGAPSTPGLGKSTVAANNVEAMADMHSHNRTVSKGGVLGVRSSMPSGIEGVSKTLSKSLESRRSSTGSRKALPFAIGIGGRGRESALASETNSLRAAAPGGDTPGGQSPTAQHSSLHAPPAQLPNRPQTPLAQTPLAQSFSPGDEQQQTPAENNVSTADGVDHQTPQQLTPEVRNTMDSLLGP